MTADRLTRAANKLRTSVDRTPGAMGDRPWRTVQGDSESMDVVAACSQHSEDGQSACAGCWTVETPNDGAAEYIALMHPPVALAIADMLDRLAPLAPFWSEPYAAPFVPIIEQGMRLAHAILREDNGMTTG